MFGATKRQLKFLHFRIDRMAERLYAPALPDEARGILLAQLERLDQLAETLYHDDDTMPLGGMASITASMCAIAKELRG